MGKGTIISAIGDGKYTVDIKFNSEYKASQIATLNTNIAKLQSDLLLLDVGTREYQLVSLKILSLEKRKAILEIVPDSENITTWCADFTDDLSGDVGIIEVPGESVEFNIRPGYNGAGVYDRGRDGFLTQTLAQTPEQAYFNASQLPGWQKWKPTFRYATVSNLSGDSCTVTFESASSTQQSLPINQTDSINNVSIEYMDCNGSAFEDGDSVLVMFINQDWSEPKVVGFKDNPKPCINTFVYLMYADQCVVWDIVNNIPAEIKNNSGDIATFPCLISSISDWVSSKTDISSGSISTFNYTPVKIPYCTGTETVTIEGTTRITTTEWDCNHTVGIRSYPVSGNKVSRSYSGLSFLSSEGEMTIDYYAYVDMGQYTDIPDQILPLLLTVPISWFQSPLNDGYQTKSITFTAGSLSEFAARICSMKLTATDDSIGDGFGGADFTRSAVMEYTFTSPFSDGSSHTNTFTQTFTSTGGVEVQYSEKIRAPYQALAKKGTTDFPYLFSCYSERVIKNPSGTGSEVMMQSIVKAFIDGDGISDVDSLNPFTSPQSTALSAVMQTIQDDYSTGTWYAQILE